MNTLFDYGEFLLCIGPIFFIIAAVGLVLLANSWPKQEGNNRNESGDLNDEIDHSADAN